VRRGDVWWAALPLPRGSEPGYRRPVVIVQGDAFNRSRIGTLMVAAITSNTALADAPGNVRLPRRASRLAKDSVVNVSQVLTLDRTALVERVGQLPAAIMSEVDDGLRLALGL